jgi:hypothetical protein
VGAGSGHRRATLGVRTLPPLPESLSRIGKLVSADDQHKSALARNIQYELRGYAEEGRPVRPAHSLDHRREAAAHR